jgi:hypothetical protein
LALRPGLSSRALRLMIIETPKAKMSSKIDNVAA